MRSVPLAVLTIALLLAATACNQKPAPDRKEPAGKAEKTPSTAGTADRAEPAAMEDPAADRDEPAAMEDPAADRDEPAAMEDPAADRDEPVQKDPSEPPVPEPQKEDFDLPASVAAVAKYIPDSPVIVAGGDIGALEEMVMKTFGGDLFQLPEDKMAAMQEALRVYHLARLGFAVQSLGRFVAFVGPTGDTGLLVETRTEVSPELHAETVAGHTLVNLIPDPAVKTFLIPDYGVGIYLKTAVDLDTYLDLVSKRDNNVERLDEFTKALAKDPAAWFAVAINFAHPIVAAAWPPDLPVKRPNKGLIQLTSHGFAVEIEAADEVLAGIEALIQMARTEGRAALDQEKRRLDSMPVGEGTAIIVADAYYDTVFDRLQPKRDGNTMRLELDLQIWGAAPVIGILAAVAIPSFIKYTKRSKTAEAHSNIRLLQRGAEDYFCTPKVDTEGNLLPHQFPPSTGRTPAAGTCCAALGGPDADGNDACDTSEALWQNESWQALRFAPSEQLFFVYEFQSNGKTGNEAEYTIRALGDLDCDGIQSTFEVRGKGIVEGEDCRVDTGNGMYIENEFE